MTTLHLEGLSLLTWQRLPTGIVIARAAGVVPGSVADERYDEHKRGRQHLGHLREGAGTCALAPILEQPTSSARAQWRLGPPRARLTALRLFCPSLRHRRNAPSSRVRSRLTRRATATLPIASSSLGRVGGEHIAASLAPEVRLIVDGVGGWHRVARRAPRLVRLGRRREASLFDDPMPGRYFPCT